MAAGHIGVLAALGLFLLCNAPGSQIFAAFAQAACSGEALPYMVVQGETLSGIAVRHNTSWQRLAAYNHIRNANLIYVNQTVCIPGGGMTAAPQGAYAPLAGRGNFFPYGQCTWWASQRYYQLHGVFVPWTANSDAWAWSNRARDYHWIVSSSPRVGDIVDLQPWVQGAYGLGHVAVVERVLGNGSVIASNMNWGAHPRRITYIEFAPARGVSFIRF
jgi:N-acetylmuramoyl-L-alanine amidase